MQPREALRQYFGHSDFRRGQRELIEAVLGVMPTGGGKSLCYQIPALCLGGTTLVISPLISLMKDQVEALEDAGVPAGYINSSLSGDELRDVYRRAYNGEYRLLYIAPERLGAPGFVKLAQTIPVPLIAVDEAHCISQWGPGLPPELSGDRRFYWRAPDPSRDGCVHRDRDSTGAGGHRAPAPPARSAARGDGL